MRDFFLDELINSENEVYNRIGEAMGSLLMVKIPDIEVRDIVQDDFSMEKITQAVMKYLLNNHTKLRTRVDEHDETLGDLQN